MRREHLAEHKGDFVPLNHVRSKLVQSNECTNLKSALLSENPVASASTAAGVPMFRSANMARYRSNRGRVLSISCSLRTKMSDDETPSGFDAPRKRPDVAGAGSMDV